MLTTGLLGAMMITAEERMASSTSGDGRACSMPSNSTPVTGSRAPRLTKYSWNGRRPAGVLTKVATRASVIGSTLGTTPSADARAAVTSVGLRPSRSHCVRARCVARSRSPSRNQVGSL